MFLYFYSNGYKSDPLFHCSVSLENESFLERFICTVLRPIHWTFLKTSMVNQLNDLRKQINVDPSPIIFERLSRTSLVLVDTFFGFEVIIKTNKKNCFLFWNQRTKLILICSF